MNFELLCKKLHNLRDDSEINSHEQIILEELIHGTWGELGLKVFKAALHPFGDHSYYPKDFDPYTVASLIAGVSNV